MAQQTFTSGQVLTAAQMTTLQTNDYNQTVSAKVASYTLVAADKGTRITMSNASATSITVNTGLFTAGDSLRIQNLNGGGVCTVTAGTATVTSAGPLAIPSWGGGQLYFTSASAAIWFPDAITVSSGLVCVKAETAFSAVASVTADSVFTSAYTNYKIIMNYTTSTTNSTLLKLRVGGVSASTNYNVFYAASTGWSVGTLLAQTSFLLGDYSNGSFNCSNVLELQQPAIATGTTLWNNATTSRAGYGSPYPQYTLGNHSTATAYDGVEFTTATGTISGTYAIYGYAKTV